MLRLRFDLLYELPWIQSVTYWKLLRSAGEHLNSDFFYLIWRFKLGLGIARLQKFNFNKTSIDRIISDHNDTDSNQRQCCDLKFLSVTLKTEAVISDGMQ